MTLRRSTIIAIIGGVLVHPLIACSGNTAAPSTTIAHTPPLEINSVPGALIDVYLDQSASDAVWVARERQIAHCMSAAGLDYEPLLPPQGHTDVYSSLLPHLPADPAADGYRINTGQTDLADPSDVPESPGFERALHGDDSTVGCWQTADETLRYEGYSISDVVGFGDSLTARASLILQADPGYLESVASWSACMADSGLEFSQPSDPVAYFLNNPSISEEERAAAKLDELCRNSTQLVDSIKDLYDASLDQVLTDPAIAESLSTFKEVRAEIIALALEMSGE